METVVVNGVAYGPTATITVGASPFSWTNPESVRVIVMLTGGTLSLVQLASPVDGTLVDVGMSCGHYTLNPGWRIRVTYIVAPTMTYTPG